ncbi:MAG: transposase [Caldilineaceae bacterium SB0665_bin_21]|nr:transposase [Caldilineaceae bacterium SB0665_bin_21]
MPSVSLPPTPPTDGARGLVKGHRIALCPNDRQASLMAEHAGWARVASNWAIDRFAEAWFTGEGEDNEWLSDMELRRQFNAVKQDLFPWSKPLSQTVAKNAIIHTGKGLDAWGAYKKALKKGQRPRRVGFPKHRKRGKHMAFTPTNGRNTIRVEGCRVRIPAIGWVRMTEPLRFAGDILSATVSLEADRWHIAFQVDTGEPAPPKRPGPTVGIDMGIQVLATLWDGDERTKILNPRPLQEALAELRRIDKAISRSIKVHGKHLPPPGSPVHPAETAVCPCLPSAQRPPPPDHHGDRQAWGHGEGGDPAHRGDAAQPETGARPLGCRPGGVRAPAGVQVRLVRDRLREGGPLVPVLEDVQCVRGREAVAAAVGAHLPLSAMRLCVRPGRERRPEPPGVRPGGQVGRRRRGDP